MNEEAQRWLSFAQDDLRSAQVLLREQIFNQVCFHAQQAAEKSLKAWIANRGDRTPRTHSIGALLTYTKGLQLDELESSLGMLDDYYTATRYPDALPGTLPDRMPEASDAALALKTAQALYGTVIQHID